MIRQTIIEICKVDNWGLIRGTRCTTVEHSIEEPSRRLSAVAQAWAAVMRLGRTWISLSDFHELLMGQGQLAILDAFHPHMSGTRSLSARVTRLRATATESRSVPMVTGLDSRISRREEPRVAGWWQRGFIDVCPWDVHESDLTETELELKQKCEASSDLGWGPARSTSFLLQMLSMVLN